MEIIQKEDEETTLQLRRYNQKRTEFEMWVFQSSGDSSYWVGKWGKSKTTYCLLRTASLGISTELWNYFFLSVLNKLSRIQPSQPSRQTNFGVVILDDGDGFNTQPLTKNYIPSGAGI